VQEGVPLMQLKKEPAVFFFLLFSARCPCRPGAQEEWIARDTWVLRI
jgi:hypothetical protein